MKNIIDIVLGFKENPLFILLSVLNIFLWIFFPLFLIELGPSMNYILVPYLFQLMYYLIHVSLSFLNFIYRFMKAQEYHGDFITNYLISKSSYPFKRVNPLFSIWSISNCVFYLSIPLVLLALITPVASISLIIITALIFASRRYHQLKQK